MNWRGAWHELTRHDQWGVGMVEAPIQAFLEQGFRPQVRWITPRRPSGYEADPFGWLGPQGLEVYCESWDAATDRGHLAWIGPGGAARRLGGFPEIHHHSYPFLVEDKGELFCLPESWQSGSVRLYRAVNPPLEWTLDATLLPGVAAADPTLFQWDGRWWLAYSDQWQGAFSTLYLWYAQALRGPWTPHSSNPVKVDLGSARPAGTPFWHEGALYRPAQDCRATYGAAVVIHRIERLTPEEFAETAVARIEPQPEWPWPDGLHTLSAAGPNATLLDAKRISFVPQEFRRVFLRMLTRNLLG